MITHIIQDPPRRRIAERIETPNERTAADYAMHRPLDQGSIARKHGYFTLYDLLMAMNPPRSLVNELRRRKDLNIETQAWLERVTSLTVK